MTNRRRCDSLLCGVLLALLSNCGSDGTGGTTTTTTPGAAVSDVVLLGTPVGGTMVAGESATLAVTSRDANGAIVTGRVAAWSSSDPAVASVTNAGVVTALGPGVSTITVTVESRTAAVAIAVRARIATPSAGASQPAVTVMYAGRLSVTVPPTAHVGSTPLSVGKAESNVPTSSELLSETAFSFGPDGTQFGDSVTLSIRFDSAGMPPRVREGLAVYVATNGDWVEVPGSVVAADVVSARVMHFSTYAVLRRAPPVSLKSTAGDNQSTAAGEAVPTAPTVIVTDAKRRALPFVDVVFAVASGGGSVVGAIGTTDAQGTAHVGRWTLGNTVGAQTLSATVSGLPPVLFTATATRRVVASLARVAGDAQVGSPNSPLSVRPSVRALGSDGQPVSGAVVTFTASAGSGQVNGGQQTTDANGVATVGDWILGPAANQQLTASSGTASVAFTASVSLVLPASALRIVSGPSHVEPSSLVPGIVVEVVNANGVRVPTANVSITPSVDSGQGMLISAPVIAAVNGVATFTGLRLSAYGMLRLKFSATGLAPAIHYIDIVSPTTSAVLTQAPTNAVDGALLVPQPVIEFRNIQGSIAKYDTGTVTARMQVTNGRLTGTTTVKAVNGVARFTDLRLAGSGWQRIELDVHSSENSRAAVPTGTPYFKMTSSQPDPAVTRIQVSVTPATKLHSGWSDAIYVYRLEKDGFLVPFSSTPVTVVADSGTAQLKSSSFNTTTSDMTVRVAGYDADVMRFRFSSPGVPDVVARVSVYQTPDSVAFRQQPGNGQSGQRLSQQPIVDVFDLAGLPFKPVTTPYTAIRLTGPPASLSGIGAPSGSVPLVNGSRVYTDLAVTGIGQFVLVFSIGGNGGEYFSRPFTISP